MLDVPNVWTDGSLVLDEVTGVSSSGSGFFAQQPGVLVGGGHVDYARPDGGEGLSCRGFCSVPGPLQTVQRAQLWEVILALQASEAVHFGVDNLNVVRLVGRLLDGVLPSRPLER